MDNNPRISSATTEEEINAAKLRLAAWISINGRAQRFRDKAGELMGLVPLANRFLGYQEYLRTLIEAVTTPTPPNATPDAPASAGLPIDSAPQ